MNDFKRFIYCLKKIYSIPSVSLIGGIWKSGKTDFALLLAELLLKLKLISKVGSNIEVSDERIEYVPSLEELKYWLKKDKRLKLYIFDEGNESMTTRRTLSTINTEIVRLFPQISKAKGRMIFIGQNIIKMDKELLNDTWLRGVWIKKQRTFVTFYSKMIPEYEKSFSGIPRTGIEFDQWTPAVFTEKARSDLTVFKEENLNLLWKWSHDKLSCEKLGIHPMKLNRIARDYVESTLTPKYEALISK